MELIRTIRKRYQDSKHEDIRRQAERYITIDDFDDSLFIACNGIPLVPIEKQWTTKEIVEELTLLRQNYVKAMTTD